MKVLAIFNVKGGTGKTTTAICLSYALASLEKKTLLIDMDPQGNASKTFGHYQEDECTIKNLLDDTDTGITQIQQVIYPSQYPNLDVIPCEIRLGSIEKQMVISEFVHGESQIAKLRNLLQTIKGQYDYVVIDCGPAAESLINLNALVAADYVFAPVKSDSYSSDGMEYMLEILQTARKVNHNLKYGGAIQVEYAGFNVDKVARDILEDAIGEHLLKTKISRSTVVPEATYMTEPIGAYKPKSKVAQEYKALAEEVLSIVNDR